MDGWIDEWMNGWRNERERRRVHEAELVRRNHLSELLLQSTCRRRFLGGRGQFSAASSRVCAAACAPRWANREHRKGLCENGNRLQDGALASLPASVPLSDA